MEILRAVIIISCIAIGEAKSQEGSDTDSRALQQVMDNHRQFPITTENFKVVTLGNQLLVEIGDVQNPHFSWNSGEPQPITSVQQGFIAAFDPPPTAQPGSVAFLRIFADTEFVTVYVVYILDAHIYRLATGTSDNLCQSEGSFVLSEAGEFVPATANCQKVCEVTGETNCIVDGKFRASEKSYIGVAP